VLGRARRPFAPSCAPQRGVLVSGGGLSHHQGVFVFVVVVVVKAHVMMMN
jgi:hypothetical protein